MSSSTPNGGFLCKPTNTWIFHNFLAFALVIALSIPAIKAQAQDFTSTNAKALASYDNARLAFDARNHSLALSYIDEALKRDSRFMEAYLLRFEVYSEKGDYPNAELALEDAIKVDGEFFRNSYYFLGLLEMQQGKYKEAQPHLEKFLSFPNNSKPTISRTETELRNCEFALNALRNPVPFNPVNMGEAINSPFPEYFPTLSAKGDMLVFTRRIEDPLAFQGVQENFYVSTNRDDLWFPAVPIKELNTEYNEGAPSISADGKTLVFTSCELAGEYGGGRKGYGSCDLFISEYRNGKWQAVRNMGPPINTKAGESQPSLSSDGGTLFFIRGLKQKDGSMNHDIFYSRRQSEGQWGIPVQLSPGVNTPGKEESVQIHPDGTTLYFASDGHPGMGGLDLYMSRRDNEGRWQKPVNLGYPINSHLDENSILVSADGKLAYFASEREGGFGALDLYQFDLPSTVKPSAITYASGRVTDAATNKPLKAHFTLTDYDRQRLGMDFYSDSATGEFMITPALKRTYSLVATAPGYLLASEMFAFNEKAPTEGYNFEIKLEKVEEGKVRVLKNVFFDTDKAELKVESYPELKELGAFLQNNPNIKIEISGHTDNQGKADYNLELSNNRAKAVKQYLLDYIEINPERIITVGYGADKPIATNDSDEGRAQNRRTEFKILSGVN